MQILAMQEDTTYQFSRSNDRPNVHITVRKMKYPLNSYMDLAFYAAEMRSRTACDEAESSITVR
jgi:hypothetical protein